MSAGEGFRAGFTLTLTLSLICGNVAGVLVGAWSALIRGITLHVTLCDLILEVNLDAFCPLPRVTAT